jgi:hypothetical protein
MIAIQYYGIGFMKIILNPHAKTLHRFSLNIKLKV